ncbi:NXPE family member 4-like [Haliotis rufescens]|uniref:NXPE family member 4-like n=1 Tax=Haliotis rufescens TaxID=6454 RepID=UPI00201F6E52|nr:NXPE family member 4-like [Haliotis rufescens]
MARKLVMLRTLIASVLRMTSPAVSRCCQPKCRRNVLGLLLVVAAGVVYLTYTTTSSSLQPVPFIQRPNFVSEAEITSDVYNLDPLSCANATLSFMFLEGEGQRTTYNAGERITVKVQLFDGYGLPKKRGGDLVRIWLRDLAESACSAGHVTDNEDGTYTGVLRAAWAGQPEIIASIAGPRESLKILYTVFEDHQTIKHINAIFAVEEEDLEVEESPCLPFPEVPGYRNVCNFTAENYGLPWYCGAPRSINITCFDWIQIVVHDNAGHLPLTKAEKVIIERNNHSQLRTRLVVTIRVDESDASSDPDNFVPCNQRPMIDTWGDVSPVGFFHKWTWVPAACKVTIDTVDHYEGCLRNRRLLIYGDSTTRQWFVHFRKLLKLKMASQMFEDGQPWHKPCLAVNTFHNYSVFWGPHELPFYGGPNRGFNRPTYVYLDELPNHSRDIVIIHYYLHFVSFHPSVFTRHIRRLYQSVESLVSRAPNVTVAIKGPHAMQDLPGRLDDYWGPVYDNIIRETFRPIMDKVLYLDYWDMTVASENESLHPNDTIVSNMVHYMLNMACRKIHL